MERLTLYRHIAASSQGFIIASFLKQNEVLEFLTKSPYPEHVGPTENNGQLNVVHPSLQPLWSEAIPHVPNWARRPRMWRKSPILENEAAKTESLQSSAMIATRWNEYRSTYTLSCTLILPYIFSSYAIAFQACFKQYRSRWPSLSHSITVKNIIASDSKMMVACRAGDLELVKELVVSRKASPTDIDEVGRPAIRVGHFHPIHKVLAGIEE